MNILAGAKEKFTRGVAEGFKRLSKIPLQETFVVFLGLEGSGKSSAIQHMFLLDAPFESPLREPMFHRFLIKDGHQLNINGLECPGLKSYILEEANGKILGSIKQRLSTYNKIPKYVFIVANISDNRFQGKYSEWNQALEKFKSLKMQLTDSDWNNTFLILTHGDVPSIQKSIDSRVDLFRTEFKSQFGKMPGYIVLKKEHMNSEDFPPFEFNKACLQLHVEKLPLTDSNDEYEKFQVSEIESTEKYMATAASFDDQLPRPVVSCDDESVRESDENFIVVEEGEVDNIAREVKNGPEVLCILGKSTNEIELPSGIRPSSVAVPSPKNAEVESSEFIHETIL